MHISTTYEIGDTIKIRGLFKTIVSVHVYLSNNVLTERYYFGNGDWFTIHVKVKNPLK